MGTVFVLTKKSIIQRLYQFDHHLNYYPNPNSLIYFRPGFGEIQFEVQDS